METMTTGPLLFFFYAVVFGLELISSYGNDDIQQKYIHRQTSGELLFQTFFPPDAPPYQELCSSLEAIRALYQEDFSSHELLIKAELLRIWHYLCRYPATEALRVYQRDDSRNPPGKGGGTCFEQLHESIRQTRNDFHFSISF